MRTTPGILILFISAFILSSCTPHFRWEGLREEIEGIRTQRVDRTLPGPYRDFAGAIHVHTMLSHDSEGSIDEIVEASRKAGSAFVITTDHHKLKVYERGFRGWYGEVLVIRGSEIIRGCKGWGGAGCNSLLVLGIDEHIDPSGLTMPQVVQKVKEMGGLAIAAHPNGYVDWDAPIDGMEIYDILDDAVDRIWKFPKWALDVIYSYGRYREVVFLSILDRPDQGMSKWDELSQTKRLVLVAGNDAHQNIRFFGRQIDPYDLTLRFVRTHVLAEVLGEEEILSALASGHAYVSFDILADATGFGFWAEAEKPAGIMGDQILLISGLKLEVRTPAPGRIRIFRNGSPITEIMGDRLTQAIHEAGVYRTEVDLKIRNRWRPWIYSNPIYVRQAKSGEQGASVP